MKKLTQLKRDDETLDTFYHGRILVLQKKKGYRFSVDAPVLADFIETREGEEVLEIGGGCGIISLLLSEKPFCHLTCLEIQPALAELARRNVRLNGLEERITVIEGDIRFYQPGKKFAVVFSNPPYFRVRSGWLGHNEERAIARHETAVTARDIMGKTAELLEAEGRSYFIYPINRYQEIMGLIKHYGLKPWRQRLVLPNANRPPRFFLVEAGYLDRPTKEMPPLILFGPDGAYTAEAKRIFAGERPEARGEEKQGQNQVKRRSRKKKEGQGESWPINRREIPKGNQGSSRGEDRGRNRGESRA